MRLRAGLLTALATLALAGPATADTWNVQGTGDGGTCNTTSHACPSLRAAIAASEATKNIRDVINVPEGTVKLGADLVIQSDMSIVGATARKTIIDGNDSFRGFEITA